MSRITFRPHVFVNYHEQTDQYTMKIDWSDSCEGDEEGDYTDQCDQAWNWLESLIHMQGVLQSYPNENTPAPQPTMPKELGDLVAVQGDKVYKIEMPAMKIEGHAAVPEGYTRLLRPKKAPEDVFPTCAHYTPAGEAMQTGVYGEAKGWAFDGYFPYHACTNKAIVGQQGFGPCRYSNGNMPRCNGYSAEEAEVLGHADGPVPVTLVKKRVNLGTVQWSVQLGVETSHHPKEEDAVQTFRTLTGTDPEPQPKPATGTPFLAGLVGACHED